MVMYTKVIRAVYIEQFLIICGTAYETNVYISLI